MTLPTLDQVMQWPGMPVHDADGTAIGTCRSVYADDDTRIPEWVEVEMPEDGIAFVPTLGAAESGGKLRLAQPAAKISGSPRFAPDAHLEPDDEKALYDHYGVAYSREHSDTLLPAAADGDAGETVPAAAPPAPRRLRRIEPAAEPTTTASAPPPRPAVAPAPTSSPSSSSSKAKPLALAAAVPVALLAARRSGVLSLLGRRKQQQRSRRKAGALALLAPLAAGAAAKVAQSRTKSGRSSDSETVIALPPAPVAVPVTAPVTVVETTTTTTDVPPSGPPSSAPY